MLLLRGRCRSPLAMVWYGVGLILPQFCPVPPSNTHAAIVPLPTPWPALLPGAAVAPAASELWLSCTISRGLDPIQCHSSARKANGLVQPTLTAPGGEFQAQNEQQQGSVETGEKPSALLITKGQKALHTWLKR